MTLIWGVIQMIVEGYASPLFLRNFTCRIQTSKNFSIKGLTNIKSYDILILQKKKNKRSIKMETKDFLFYDKETGEEFFVEVETLDDALAIANNYFESPCLIDVMTTEEADILGYDTY